MTRRSLLDTMTTTMFSSSSSSRGHVTRPQSDKCASNAFSSAAEGVKMNDSPPLEDGMSLFSGLFNPAAVTRWVDEADEQRAESELHVFKNLLLTAEARRCQTRPCLQPPRSLERTQVGKSGSVKKKKKKRNPPK